MNHVHSRTLGIKRRCLKKRVLWNFYFKRDKLPRMSTGTVLLQIERSEVPSFGTSEANIPPRYERRKVYSATMVWVKFLNKNLAPLKHYETPNEILGLCTGSKKPKENKLNRLFESYTCYEIRKSVVPNENWGSPYILIVPLCRVCHIKTTLYPMFPSGQILKLGLNVISRCIKYRIYSKLLFIFDW